MVPRKHVFCIYVRGRFSHSNDLIEHASESQQVLYLPRKLQITFFKNLTSSEHPFCSIKVVGFEACSGSIYFLFEEFLNLKIAPPAEHLFPGGKNVWGVGGINEMHNIYP